MSQEKEKPRHHDFEEVILGIRRLRSRGFFGTITLGMQKGEVTQVEPKPTLKPGDSLEVWLP